MNILITGGCGYIGSHVCKTLDRRGYKLTILDNLSTGSKDSIPLGSELIIGDISNTSLLQEVISAKSYDGVFHFAASISVPESINNPIKYYKNNTINTFNLTKAIHEQGIKNFIFSSTAAVYGNISSGIAEETTPTSPESTYGWSKLMSERIITDILSPTNFTILRYFNVAGADPELKIGQRNPKSNHLIRMCCLAALDLIDTIEIFGTDYPTPDGTGIRDYIHVQDLAEAHVAALEHMLNNKSNQIFNVGYGSGHSVHQIIEATNAVTGKDINVRTSSRRLGDIAKMIAKNEKILSTLDWNFKYSKIEDIIKHTWLWEKKMLLTQS